MNKPIFTVEKTLYPISYSQGFLDFIKNSKGKLIRGLLTISFDLVAKKIEKDLKLDFCFCNFLHRKNGSFSGTLDYFVLTWQKHKKIPLICKLYNVSPEEIYHVGDNENDLSVGEKVSLFVAYNPKQKISEKKAKYVINGFRELNEIL